VKSIFNRLTSHHLDDAALAALWTATADGSRDVIIDPHLERCAECRVRFSAFGSWMNDVREDALTEAELAFPTERLVAQQAQILKRLEASERPARVIVFPKFPGRNSSHRSPITRWVATGVAAGLIMGIGLGNMMDFRHIGERREARPVIVPITDASGRGVVPVNASVSEETLFQELEAAATPQYDALRSFDTFTPSAADLIASSR
jgi:hypothetical protein